MIFVFESFNQMRALAVDCRITRFTLHYVLQYELHIQTARSRSKLIIKKNNKLLKKN